uniref:Uncharacterized protein LOC114327836 isoform X2 n=1 Tax=Diabrotica virgifera virgifera TaxID=50390 RepID=A0A6P7F950_DIAVI
MSWKMKLFEIRPNIHHDEEIEMENFDNNSTPELIESKRNIFTSGCFGFLQKTWAKFTETKEVHPDDLDSLDLYYLSTLLVIVVIAVSLAVCRWYVKKRRKSTHEQQHLNWILNNPMIKYVHHTENGDTEGESNDDKVYVEPIEFHNIAFPEQNIPTQNAVTSGDPQRISVQTVADEEFLYDYAYGALSKKPTKSPTLPKRPTKSPKSRKKSEPQKKMSIPMEDKYYM